MSHLANLLADKAELQKEQNVCQCIYTTSYTDKDVTPSPNLLESLDTILIGIRFVPTGKQIEWRKDYLKLLQKTRYLPVPNLGKRSLETSGNVRGERAVTVN